MLVVIGGDRHDQSAEIKVIAVVVGHKHRVVVVADSKRQVVAPLTDRRRNNDSLQIAEHRAVEYPERCGSQFGVGIDRVPS